MKKKMLFLAAIIFCITVVIAFAGSLELAWDPNPESEQELVAGYRIFLRTSSQPTYDYENPVAEVSGRVTTTHEFTLPDVAEGQLETFYSVIRAFSFGGVESADSNEVSYTVDNRIPSAPTGYRCSFKP